MDLFIGEETRSSVVETMAALATVRGIIADAALGADEIEPMLGEITLMPHQRAAIRVLRHALARFGGALLADEVGLGKTFTALGVARRYRRPLVVVPASLRSMWRASLVRASCRATIVSYEQLSAGYDAGGEAHDLLVLDEAHHARTPSTRRYAALARLAWGAHVLLVSATPLHNRRHDLQALFALFLGSGARDVGGDVLSQLVCRQRAEVAGAGTALPRLRELEWETITESPQILAAIQSLPPPLPPSDGGYAHALSTLALIRAWCSSDAALLGAIRRRLQTAVALEHALSHGRHPTRTELTSWAAANGAVQLAFPELASTGGGIADAPALLESLRAHGTALRQLRRMTTSMLGRDDARFRALRRLVDRHRTERILVFTHSADTARAAYDSLRGQIGVACLTGRGAVIASGRLPRAEVLRAFAPRVLAPASHAAMPQSPSLWSGVDSHGGGEWHEAPNSTSIDVLVATDVLSEGVDLQLASVVVHLDLPWTMARFEQRVGRARRIGAAHAEVAHYAIAPPVNAIELERVVHHLSTKARLTRDLVGISDTFPRGFQARPSPGPGAPAPAGSPPDAIEALRRHLLGWSRGAPNATRLERLGNALPEGVVAACRSHRSRARHRSHGSHGSHGSHHGHRRHRIIAALRDGQGLFLVAGAPGAPSIDARRVLQLARAADERVARPIGEAEELDIVSSLRRWCASRDGALDALSALATRSPPHRAFTRRLSLSLGNAPRHLRLQRAVATRDVRDLVERSRGSGAEAALRRLLDAAPPLSGSDLGEAEWLAHVMLTLEPRAVPGAAVGAPGATTIVALLVLVPDG